MVQIGQYNKLKVVKHADFGVFLDGGDDGEILLPLRYMPDPCEVGDELEVFICYDSEDRLLATTEEPFAQVGDFAHLKVKAIEKVGAFLDWGLTKDLFLPYSEQTRELRAGQYVIVFIYLDKSDRITASMRLDRFIEKEPGNYQEGEAVNLFIAAKTDLGFKAIINGRHWGVLYQNEVFQPLYHGERVKGYIKQIRPDGKIDLSLQQLGHKGSDDIGEKILDLLKQKRGFLPLTEKTAPEEIYKLFGVSKKKYKMALGGLYKKRLVTIQDDGIRLVED
ncbi:MAG: GntR family transcriptional regulator [Bdellovibrio sp. ArHS]|uniref:CvfB family protein n=1 Tax=Bdellovibrio sp. ArHS TaxID=1569284 RepID=UPI00058290B5|nr:S1-like domain-containing RNA-binding protein [Bdellovibrio sp. ArHS]KHD87531.1 MAG: GntR family transcriptional regulator [Bdellovibrio sp. ArHS]